MGRTYRAEKNNSRINGYASLDPDSLYKKFATHSLLTQDEERNLLESCKSEDKETRKKAKEKLVSHNLRFVFDIAREMFHPHGGFTFEDVVQTGILGLIDAIDRYDLSMNTRLSTPAGWWIMQKIKKAYKEESRLIRWPQHIYEKLNEFNDYLEKYRREGKEPTLDDFKKEKPHLILVYQAQKSRNIASLEEIARRKNGNGRDDNIEEIVDSRKEPNPLPSFSAMIEQLNPRKRTILTCRILDGCTCDETADILGKSEGKRISRERVRQVELKAYRELKCKLSYLRECI